MLPSAHMPPPHLKRRRSAPIGPVVTRRAGLLAVLILSLAILISGQAGARHSAAVSGLTGRSGAADRAQSTELFETGFRIDHEPFQRYFDEMGGVRTFGYPVSRTVRLLGCAVQFFQRHVMQQCAAGPVQLMNLLDPGLMPVNRINGSTLPAHTPVIAAAAPPPATPNYSQAVLSHLLATVPDTFEGLPVDFLATYMSTVPLDADHPAPIVLRHLEIWGFPTSAPALDPANHGFAYQRFQRGILHYDHASGVTRGLLLGDWFKSVITGQGLPGDLAAQMQDSPFIRQYCPAQPGGLCRPAELPATDLTAAFEPGAPVATPTPVPSPAAVATPSPAPPGPPTPTPAMSEQQRAIEAALDAAARHLGLPRNQLRVERIEPRDWPDTSLGCPQPGMFYAQVITPGYLIVAGGGGRQVAVHTDTRGNAVIC